jgi:hypothetical protein
VTCRASLAEFERELIQDRVPAGLSRVKATGRTRSGRAIGRPRRHVDLDAVHRLRAEGRMPRPASASPVRDTVSRPSGLAAGGRTGWPPALRVGWTAFGVGALQLAGL